MKVAYIDPVSGVSGDMTLGGLIDAGVDPEQLQEKLRGLHLNGWHLEWHKVMRHSIAATKVDVVLDQHEHAHRHLSHIEKIIEESDLSKGVKSTATAIFRRLAEAEAVMHNTTPEKVHFHEVGAVDAIVDIVGACIGFEMLNVEKVYCSRFRVGRGTIGAAHGTMPVPAPGTLELLRGFPVEHTEIEAELVTPTGAAILTTIATEFGKLPTFTPESVGYGAGSRDLKEIANLLRIEIGEVTSDTSSDNPVLVIETNIDDMNPEVWGYVLQRLLDSGARDAFLTPIIMKKTRPAVKLTVLCDEKERDGLADIIFTETTTLGLRMWSADRITVERTAGSVITSYGEVKTKVTKWKDKSRVTPEFEECARIARSTGVPIREVYRAVQRESEK